MSIIAGIAIDAEAFVIGQILSATTTRIDLTQFVPVDGRLSPYFWKERGGDREAFEARVRADDRVASLTNLDGRTDAHLYHVEWAEDVDGFLTALCDHDILVEGARTTAGGECWVFRLRAHTQQDLSAFQEACFEKGVSVDVRRVHQNPDQRDEESILNLSEKQREALVTALKQGYFDAPRGKSQEQIAASMNISRQAFAKRLRRAEKNVFEDLFWQEFEPA